MSSSSGNRSKNNGASSSYPPPPITSSRLYIANKAKEILATRDAAGITKLVTNLCYAKESDESSSLLYKTFKKHFPNLLAVKLIHAYRFMTTTTTTFPSSRSCVRAYSLELLTSLLIDLEESNVALKKEALNDIKEHLNACLAQQETSDREFKLLTRIVSRVSVDFFIESIPWDELSSFIVSLDDDKKMLLMFGELPTVLDEDFLKPLLENDLAFKIVKGLFHRDRDDDEWCLALEAGFNLMLQMINLERKDLVWDSVYAIVSSVWEMVNVRKRDVVVRKGLLRLVRKVRGEALRFRGAEYEFVSRLALMIERVDGLGDDTKIAAKMIRDVLDRYYMGGTGLDSSGFIQSLIGTHHSA